MSGTLALSSLIASLDRAGLTSLVRSRRVAAPGSVHDPLDLAAELLKPESISQALTLLPWEDLARLIGAEEGGGANVSGSLAAERLRGRGLLGAGDVALPEVSAALESLLAARGLTRREVLDGDPGEGFPAAPEGSDTSSWFAAALTATGQTAWILRELERSPAKLNRNGDVASAWLRAVEDRLAIPHPADLVTLVRAADLAFPADGVCVSTGANWLRAEHEERWLLLARAAVSLMPVQLLEMLAGLRPGTAIPPVIGRFPARFPLATETTFTAIEHTAALWERIGLTVAGSVSDVGATVILNELSQLPAAAADDTAVGIELGFPDPAAGIYIQPDLSVIVPGTLGADDEAALAAIALPEQLGVASTLRISEATLSEAFHRGLSGDDIRELIGGLALTGIPQPVDYLITALSERAGSIVVRPFLSEQWRSRVTFARPELRSTVLVDRRLAHLQLHEPGPGTDVGFDPSDDPADLAAPSLLSRLRADHVLAALLDARYPARGAEGLVAQQDPEAPTSALRPSGARRAAEAPGPAERQATAAEELIERVLDSASDGPTDTSRLITLAIRDRTRLSVTVEIRGETRTFAIVPVSLAGGRMRALDETAGVERTLPLDAITEISQLA
ncbi:XPB/Ssl2-like helicase family protein [Leucobacter komagatae]|uniref:XPB/Ssl2-like helicase family protein n=1 Tax=Leucobacter komagatae TaxID=55969 RepID=A0A542Y691_9MICO|nr:helicase-associated domain-containing protein [Leucobacter komagatae]TQL43565.1 XPB/Ssl2-like helicase family protein [Leucobacter komagatae]